MWHLGWTRTLQASFRLESTLAWLGVVAVISNRAWGRIFFFLSWRDYVYSKGVGWEASRSLLGQRGVGGYFIVFQLWGLELHHLTLYS